MNEKIKPIEPEEEKMIAQKSMDGADHLIDEKELLKEAESIIKEAEEKKRKEEFEKDSLKGYN